MKMLIKQRFLSWFDSYDVYDVNDEVLYVCKGQFSWGHTLKVFDQNERELGMIKEKVWSFLPKFEVYKNDVLIGTIAKEFTFLTPKFNIDYNSWKVEGDVFSWDYEVKDKDNNLVSTIKKKIWKLTDTYEIDVVNKEDCLNVLMLVLAIDIDDFRRNAS